MSGMNSVNPTDKFNADTARTLFPFLVSPDQAFLRHISTRYRFTTQEVRILAQTACDLRMWRETPLAQWWEKTERTVTIDAPAPRRKQLMRLLSKHVLRLQRGLNRYPPDGLKTPPRPPCEIKAIHAPEKTIAGLCPVASDATICCQLRTIDAVENCGFHCNYCTIQTFYGDAIRVDPDLGKKLDELPLEPNRFYHFGTGQSSDALLWGNAFGILDTLCDFAAAHPNILMEFKTKSGNTRFFHQRRAPRNVVCSWSLNPQTIIRNEEHFTADLETRLRAAEDAVAQGVDVAFHFHPIIHYENWETEYSELAEQILTRFSPEHVRFISLGTLTYIKPVLDAIRRRGGESKMLQMELVPGAKGKLTYPEKLKKTLFSHIYRAFTPWHNQVYFYLCMEPALFWQSTFGFCYPDNATFEQEFGRATMR